MNKFLSNNNWWFYFILTYLISWPGWGVNDQPFVWLLIYCIPLSVILTWLYYRSGGSIIPVMLLHAGTNVVFRYFLRWRKLHFVTEPYQGRTRNLLLLLKRKENKIIYENIYKSIQDENNESKIIKP